MPDLILLGTSLCEIGCGTPLLALFSPSKGLLFSCSECQGIWDDTLFTSDDPQLYGPEDFQSGELTFATLEQVKRAAPRFVSPLPDKEANCYVSRLKSFLGDRLK
jgi:hypothetical protein